MKLTLEIPEFNLREVVLRGGAFVAARLGDVDRIAKRIEEGGVIEHSHRLVVDDVSTAGQVYPCVPRKCEYGPEENVYMVDGVLQPPGYNPLLPETYARETRRKYRRGNYRM